MNIDKIKQKITEDKIIDVVLFLAIFCSSILGAQLFGISLNKLGLIPLELYLLYKVIQKQRIVVRREQLPLIVFYAVQIVGSWFALLNTAYLRAYGNYFSTLAFNILQNLFIYLPIVFGFGLLENKSRIFQSLKRSIVLVARLQCVWAFVQFLEWNLFSFDVNNFLFVDVLKGGLGEGFKTKYISLNGLHIRATGLNCDPAALAAVMLVGCCFDKNVIWKCAYLFACVMGMSRTGIVGVMSVLGVQIFAYVWQIKQDKENRKALLKPLFIGGGAVVAVALGLYVFVPFVRELVNNAIARFTGMGHRDDGSSRHIMYPVYALYSWFMDLNILQKLVGVGARISGLVFVHSPYVSSNMDFNTQMLTTAWEVECDTAALLLGDGLIGFIAYLVLMIRLIKTKRLELVSLGAGLLVSGIMYTIFSHTLLQIIMIVLLETQQLEKHPAKKRLLEQKRTAWI